MAITGDFKSFQAMRAGLSALEGSSEILLDIVTPKIADLVKAQLGAGQTPHGRKWKPRRDGSPALTMMGGRARVSTRGGTDIVVEVDSDPAKFHQAGAKSSATGKRRLPSRRMIPQGKNLPPTWRKAFVDSFPAFLEKMVSKFGTSSPDIDAAMMRMSEVEAAAEEAEAAAEAVKLGKRKERAAAKAGVRAAAKERARRDRANAKSDKAYDDAVRAREDRE
jgi:hypothetical protein